MSAATAPASAPTPRISNKHLLDFAGIAPVVVPLLPIPAHTAEKSPRIVGLEQNLVVTCQQMLDRTQCLQAIVIGPVPPGIGVIHPATSATGS